MEIENANNRNRSIVYNEQQHRQRYCNWMLIADENEY
jgi:hypothetical protein